MRCPFGFAMLQRSRLRLVKTLTGEFMRANKLDFLKENILFRNGKSKEELLRNTTTVSTAVNRELMERNCASWANCGFIKATNKRADGFNFLAADFLGMFVGAVYTEGGGSNTQIITGLIANLFWNTILINRFFIFRTVFTKCLKNVLRFA